MKWRTKHNVPSKGMHRILLLFSHPYNLRIVKFQPIISIVNHTTHMLCALTRPVAFKSFDEVFIDTVCKVN